MVFYVEPAQSSIEDLITIIEAFLPGRLDQIKQSYPISKLEAAIII